MNSIGLGNEIRVVDEQGDLRWAWRFMEDASMELVRFDETGLELDTPIVIASTGAVTIANLSTTNAAVAYRPVLADVIPTITRADNDGMIELLSSAVGAKAILTDVAGDDAVVVGQETTFFLAAATAGSYTLALSTGTLTFDAARESATVVRTSLGWNVKSLNGATIV